jgi:hypothetical protein
LSYDYAGRTVWLDPLLDDDHPARHDLCGRHADRLSAPNRWRLEDRRAAVSSAAPAISSRPIGREPSPQSRPRRR